MGPLLLGLVLVLDSSVLAQVRDPVPVLWMMPEGPDSALLPAVTLALDDLRKQRGAAEKYELQLHSVDAQCDGARALRTLFDLMWAEPEHLLLLGGACPSVTSLIAQALPALNLVQVSFVAPPPHLSNRKWFGHMISTVPSERALNRAAVKLLQNQGWSRVGLVSERTDRITQSLRDLLLQLDQARVQVVSSQRFSGEACSALKELKDRDVRIIIAQFEEDSASEVFCCAYRLNLFGPRVQWLLLGAAGGWSLGWRESGCTANSLLTAADGSIRVQVQALRYSQEPGLSGRTAEEYEELYLRQLARSGLKVAPLHGFAYDAVWVAALALGRVLEEQKTREKFRINSTQVQSLRSERVLQALKSTRFTGVTGPVVFRDGERMTTLELIQFQGSSSVLVGDFNPSDQSLRLDHNLLKFKGGRPPRDRTEVRSELRHVTLTLYVVMATASSLIILLSLSILCFCLLNRKLRVRWRAVSQEELLLLGVILCCSSVLVSGLDQVSVSDRTRTVLCSVQLWTLSLGQSVVFSLFFSEAWVLFSLTHRLQKSDLQRPGRVLLWTLLLDVFVLSSWQLLDPLSRVELLHQPQPDPSDGDLQVRAVALHCSSADSELWLTAVCGYKGPLLGLGLFVVWSLGPGLLSLSLKSGLSALSLFSALGVLAYISHDPLLQFSLSSGFVLSGCLSVLASAFGPKFFLLGSKGSDLKLPTEIEEEEEPGAEMKTSNLQLRMRTLQLDAEIENLSLQLSDPDPPLGTNGDTHEACGVRGGTAWTHEVQVCAEDSETEDTEWDHINSPEHVSLRVSLQPPILHLSYLPVIGGVSPSSTDASLH